MKIGQTIKALRQQAGISQETLARALAVTPQAVSRWETEAAAPDISLLPALAGYFGVSIDALFAWDDSRTARLLEEFFDAYYAALQDSEDRARALLQDALRRFPGQEAVRLLQCFHLRAPEDLAARTALCRELSHSQNPTVRTEAIILLAHACHAAGDDGGTRDYLARLPECDATKLSLSARFFSGEEAMLCAQRQKSSSLAMLFSMLLRIAELYQTDGAPDRAQQTLFCARSILEALKEDAPYAFPKGNRSDAAWVRFAEEFGGQIASRLEALAE